MPKTVLVVEDDAALQEGAVAILQALGFKALSATSLKEVARVFSENHPSPGIDGIIWDGNLHDGDSFAGDEPGTIRWVIAQGFAGPMVACSIEHKDEQIKAGCQHRSRKSDAPDLLASLLGVT